MALQWKQTKMTWRHTPRRPRVRRRRHWPDSGHDRTVMTSLQSCTRQITSRNLQAVIDTFPEIRIIQETFSHNYMHGVLVKIVSTTIKRSASPARFPHDSH